MSETLPENTLEQIAAHEAADAQWERERQWPLWDVEITGDEVEWVARAGVNLDDDGNPQPWVATARATVRCHARNEDHAKMIALQANPEYHTVADVQEVA